MVQEKYCHPNKCENLTNVMGFLCQELVALWASHLASLLGGELSKYELGNTTPSSSLSEATIHISWCNLVRKNGFKTEIILQI